MVEPTQQCAWPIPMFFLMIKPGGPACNMACEYCYYRHKLHTMHSDVSTGISDALLETLIRQYIQSQHNPTVFFTWL